MLLFKIKDLKYMLSMTLSYTGSREQCNKRFILFFWNGLPDGQ